MSLHRPISVVLADDHAMVRDSLARVLGDCNELSIVGQVGDGTELMDTVQKNHPDCLVMDYSMPGHDPIETIRKLSSDVKGLKILVLTVHENVHYAVRTLEAGANGYLIKSAAVEELVNAIRMIYDGNVYISKKISAEVWAKLRRPKGHATGWKHFLSGSSMSYDSLEPAQRCRNVLNSSTSA